MNLEIREPLPSLAPGEAFRRWRDELPLRAADLPQLGSLHEQREQRDEHLERQLLFTLDVEFPALVRSFLPSGALDLELVERFQGEAGTWSLHSRGVPREAAMARGTLSFVEKGSGSELVADGNLHLDLGALPRPPGFWIRAMEPHLERGLARGIERALCRLARLLTAPERG